MELPIQLKFFKKLELYQEIKFQDRKNKTQPALLNVWNTEKEILSWTVLNHHNLGNTITDDFVRKNILKMQSHVNIDEVAKKYDIHLTDTFENLIKRGYAERSTQDVSNLIFTKEGLLIGEVIYDIKGDNIWNRHKYPFFYFLTWVTTISGALIVIVNALIMIVNFLKITLWC